MTHRTDRRKFLKSTAALGVGFWVAGGVSPRPSRAANETINFACIGVDGKGRSDSFDASRHGNVVAICDIDETKLEKGALVHSKAKKFFDYRKMLDEMHKSIDAVTVSVPDHNHAAAAVMAMKLGKHCFCQKPLTHSIWEARVMARVARQQKVITQMGNQGTAEACLRHSAALVQAGAIGTVHEVHVWTNRPIWPQGLDRPKETPPVPSYIHWPEWIGPAKMRPYHPAYHPFKWRGWWDFGTGALGDMACHTMNMPFMALNLRDPVAVTAETSGHNKETYPKWSVITYEFPALDNRPALKMIWYDGGKKPPAKLLPTAEQMKLPPNRYNKVVERGALLVGEKGSLLSTGDYGGDDKNTGILYPDGSYVRQKDVRMEVSFEESPGHFTEFALGIKTGKTPRSNFPGYAVPLTETVLLGNLAVWASGRRIEWDAQGMRAVNGDEELAAIVKPTFHNGYKL